MAWDMPLHGMQPSEIDQVMLHPEHLRNLAVVTDLLEGLDSSSTADDLYDVQAELFRFSYRAQMAAFSIGRALGRLKSRKQPDWSPVTDGAPTAFALPSWHLRCDPACSDPDEWVLERRVAERVIRQLRSVGDSLAWRVYGYDRRVLIALSRNDPPGPFVNKAGLGYELGRITDIKRKSGNFALFHDLTSVIRVLDVTEVDAAGRRHLQEVKSGNTRSAQTKAAKQIKRAERLLAAVEGGQPLPDEEAATLWRATAQHRTDARALVPLLDHAERQGFASARIRDRIIGIVHLLTVARNAQSPQALWNVFAARRDLLLDRHIGLQDGLHRLTASSPDSAARDPAVAPWGIYPWPANHRAALICDYLALQVFMSADQVAERFQRRGCSTQMLLPVPGGVFDGTTGVISVRGEHSSMTVHGNAVYQLLMEFIDTSRFVDASLEVLRLPRSNINRTLLVYSNERASWH
ncbi:hypothetical protein [Streptomyces sp. NPDC026659]|uniref:hypothetical protein n=1 Tax=Streptomyces sp. NPDC026659 TaxID=3155123 RepID=UPI0033DD1CA2